MLFYLIILLTPMKWRNKFCLDLLESITNTIKVESWVVNKDLNTQMRVTIEFIDDVNWEWRHSALPATGLRLFQRHDSALDGSP